MIGQTAVTKLIEATWGQLDGLPDVPKVKIAACYLLDAFDDRLPRGGVRLSAPEYNPQLRVAFDSVMDAFPDLRRMVVVGPGDVTIHPDLSADDREELVRFISARPVEVYCR